jgi:hypothetical protein
MFGESALRPDKRRYLQQQAVLAESQMQRESLLGQIEFARRQGPVAARGCAEVQDAPQPVRIT